MKICIDATIANRLDPDMVLANTMMATAPVVAMTSSNILVNIKPELTLAATIIRNISNTMRSTMPTKMAKQPIKV